MLIWGGRPEPEFYKIIGRAGVERVTPPILSRLATILIGIVAGCLLAGGTMWWADRLAGVIAAVLTR